MVVLWIVVALAFAVVEVMTTALFAVFLAVAAVGAAAAAWLGWGLLVQGAVFFVLAVAGVAVARPPLLRYLARRRIVVPTLSGAQEMIGRTAVVTEPIPGANQPGHVEIMGERWPAVSADGNPVKEGREVTVVDIRRATLVVAPH